MIKGFPTKYYLVDHEIFVKLETVIDKDGKEVVMGKNDLGSPYNPMRAIINGREISKKEFEIGAAKRKKEYP